jgi:hypothetical protein
MQLKKRVRKRDFINFIELLSEPGTLGYGVLLVWERGRLILETVDDDDGNHHLPILRLEEPIIKTLQSCTKNCQRPSLHTQLTTYVRFNRK